MAKFKRILLKLSGESLMGEQGYGIDVKRLNEYAAQIKEVAAMGVQIGIVIGGGNIFRGLTGAGKGFDRVKGDQMGMMATVINSLALSSALGAAGVPNKVLTAIRMEPVGEFYTKWKAIEAMEQGMVVIMAAGTGSPYFTTDTGSSLRGIEIEADVMLQAIEQVESDTRERTFIFVKGENWHQGVVGIVAGRLKERYNLPVLVMGIEGDEVKGSARSVAGIDIGTIIMNAVTKGHLTRGGGHPMAAGFSLTKEQLPAFENYLSETITIDKLPSGPAQINVDGILDLGGVSWDLAEQLDLLAPYGDGNSEPTFIIQNATLGHVNLLKNGHISCSLTNMSGQRLNAIAFKVADTDLGQAFLRGIGQRFHILGTLKKDVWNGRKKVQLQIQDAMIV